eukprot:scaffold166884_cov18-Tisochrysis_lutea.AAC.1
MEASIKVGLLPSGEHCSLDVAIPRHEKRLSVTHKAFVSAAWALAVIVSGHVITGNASTSH